MFSLIYCFTVFLFFSAMIPIPLSPVLTPFLFRTAMMFIPHSLLFPQCRDAAFLFLTVVMSFLSLLFLLPFSSLQ
jgi:hypothetical protein